MDSPGGEDWLTGCSRPVPPGVKRIDPAERPFASRNRLGFPLTGTRHANRLSGVARDFLVQDGISGVFVRELFRQRLSPGMATSAPTTPGSSLSSTHREASNFVVWGAGIILLAHGVEVVVGGRPNWPAFLLRIGWTALLLAHAWLLRQGGRTAVLAGAIVAIFGSVLFDLALLAVTGRSASPLLGFTPVLATVLPFMSFEVVWIGLAGSAVLMGGTWLMLATDAVPFASFVSLANAGGGALACGWLLARVYERARRAEEARRTELSEAMASIKTHKGLLPVCAWCHRVRTDEGYWKQIEAYVAEHSDARFTHGVCQDCYRKQFGEEDAEGT